MLGLSRDVRLVFQPRADAEHFCVALASMVSKYLRELLMLEFNRLLAGSRAGAEADGRLPGRLRPLLRRHSPAAERLAIPEAALWRRK